MLAEQGIVRKDTNKEENKTISSDIVSEPEPEEED